MAEDGSSEGKPLGVMFAQLADDAKEYASAEIAYHRELALTKARELRNIAVFGALALLFALAAVVAIAVGAVMVLVPEIGGLAATLVVTLATLILSALFGWFAWTRLSALLEPEE